MGGALTHQRRAKYAFDGVCGTRGDGPRDRKEMKRPLPASARREGNLQGQEGNIAQAHCQARTAPAPSTVWTALVGSNRKGAGPAGLPEPRSLDSGGKDVMLTVAGGDTHPGCWRGSQAVLQAPGRRPPTGAPRKGLQRPTARVSGLQAARAAESFPMELSRRPWSTLHSRLHY